MIGQTDATTSIPTPVNAATQKRQGDLREAIDQVIGSVFFGPLMKSMRSSAFKSEFGHGGRGEEIFSAQLDQILVERAGTATSYELGNALFDRFAPSVRQQESPISSEVGDTIASKDLDSARSVVKQ